MMKSSISLLALALALSASARGEVRMPAIFGDHMVLQQQQQIPVWGWAAPGERVSVNFAGKTGQVIATSAGKWQVNFPPLPANTAPGVLTVSGRNTLKFEDVLVGDVWLASGQSNMEFGVQMSNGGGEAIAAAKNPLIRLFCVPAAQGATPQEDVAAAPEDHPLEGHWQVCTPETLANSGPWGGFSGVAYFFGRDIQKFTKQPLGLIASHRGGTPAQAWTSLEGLSKPPPFTKYIEQSERNLENYKKVGADYPRELAAYLKLKKAWNAEVKPSYDEAMKAWSEEAKKAQAASQPEPPRPQPSRPAPSAPNDPTPQYQQPICLFNAMIAPLIPYALKGVIWYQGESNAMAAAEYATLFPRMIGDWREKWGQRNFPFLYVQLAGYTAMNDPAYAASHREENFPLLRESQLKTLALPQTGMAVAIDVGGGNDIHPRDKMDVGARLALAAQRVAYGQKLVSSGPLYLAMRPEGRQIRLAFSELGSGLTPGLSPLAPKGTPAPTELVGFTIAGADHHFIAAKARIDGRTIVVSSDQVPAPVAVRYGWDADANCNLYNREGLPASPFRTDSFPE